MISMAMPQQSPDISRANAPVNPTYQRVTILWMVLMASVGLGVWIWLFGGVAGTGVAISDAPRAQVDDAAAVIARFGAPEIDRVDGPDTVDAQNTTPGFFSTMGIPLRRGRDFTAHDAQSAPLVVIINESLARRFWPTYPNGPDPIGQHLVTGDEALRRLMSLSP